MTPSTTISNDELSKHTKCLMFDLPAELRVKMYSLVFQESELEEDRNITRREGSACDHNDHITCRRVWKEDKPHLLLDPNIETNFEMFGIPTRPIPLLATCSSCDDKTFKTFRGEALQQLVAKAKLTVQIRRGNPYGWGYCSTCAYGLEGVVERYPVLLKYFCSRMKHVEFDVFFEKPTCVANNLQRLANVADALDADCTVESISLTTESKASWRGPDEWKKLEEKWIRGWKGGAYELSKRLPPSRARSLLWRAIDGSFKDVSGKHRQWCKLEEICDSRLVKRSAKSGAAQRDGNRTRVEYWVIRDGHWKPEWEHERYLLPQWQAMIVQFHEKYSRMPQPDEIAILMKGKELLVATHVGSNTSRLSRFAETQPSAASEDVEDDLVFAKAMSKLAVKGRR